MRKCTGEAYDWISLSQESYSLETSTQILDFLVEIYDFQGSALEAREESLTRNMLKKETPREYAKVLTKFFVTAKRLGDSVEISPVVDRFRSGLWPNLRSQLILGSVQFDTIQNGVTTPI